MSRGVAHTLVAVLLFSALWPAWGLAQPPAGVVTTIHGTATVARTAAPPEIPLKFRDDLFLRDRISTKENSIVRALLGGKALVTIRELSVLTITEEVGRATVDMEAGKIALSVARQRMRPGETLEIRTPNAIAAVRGTVVIVEIIRATAQATPALPTVVTNFHVLRGSIDVFLRTAPTATPVTVRAGLSLGITGNTLGQTRPSPPVEQVVQGLKSEPQHTDTPAEAKREVSNKGVANAATLATVLARPGEAAGPRAAHRTEPAHTRTTRPTEAPVISTTKSEEIVIFAKEKAEAEKKQALVEKAPVEKVPVEKAPVEKVPVEKAPVEKAPVPLPTTTPTATTPTADVPDIQISGTSVNLASGETLKTFSGTVSRSGTSPVVSVVNSTISQSGAGNLIQTASGAAVTLNGSLLVASTSTITSGGNLLRLSSTLTEPGPLLDLTDTTLTLTGAVAQLSGGSTLKVTSGPAFRIKGGSLTADALGLSTGTGNTFDLTGTGLDLTNTTVTLRTLGDVKGKFSLALNEPAIRMSSSTLTLTGVDEELVGVGKETGPVPTEKGVALIATGTPSSKSTINLKAALLDMAAVTSTATDALLQLTNSTVSQTGTSAGIIFVDPSTLASTMAGPMLKATGSAIKSAGPFMFVRNGSLSSATTEAFLQLSTSTVETGTGLDGSLLRLLTNGKLNLKGSLLSASSSTLTLPQGLANIFGGGQLSVTDSTAPLVSITGGTHSIASASGSAMFILIGVATAIDPETVTTTVDPFAALTASLTGQPVPTQTTGGLTLGTDKPLQHGGVVLETSGATVSGQKVLGIDTALLEASAPLLNLKPASNFTTSVDALDLSVKAKVTSVGPVVKLDASTFTVTSGALFRVAGGSFLKVTGDLLELSNGSILNILNGPTLNVSGGSIVNVSGALVSFSGTGSNQLNVTNSLCAPCTTVSGIPVALKDGAVASNVSIGSSPIKNSSLGSLNPSSSNAAVIVVSGSTSKVTISGTAVSAPSITLPLGK